MRLLALGPFPEFQNFQQGVSFLYKMSPYLKCIVQDGKYRSKYLVSNIKQKQYQYRMTSPSSVKHNLITFQSKSKRETTNFDAQVCGNARPEHQAILP